MSNDCFATVGRQVSPWHRKFAWFPTETCDHGWKWLRFIWRRRLQGYDHFFESNRRWWQYCALPPADRVTPSPPTSDQSFTK
jgi:hypothetical protein